MLFMRDLIEKIKDRKYKVGIIGLGYAGLPLLRTFHKEGFPVIGFDTDEAKIKAFENKKSYIKHFSDKQIVLLAESDLCTITSDFSLLSTVDAVLICVPTPLNKNREPDMTFVVETSKTISSYLRKRQLVVLESTTWPGTSDELMRNILEDGSGLKAGKDFYIAYSPEREDPGNPDFDTKNIPKIVGTSDSKAEKIAVKLYKSVLDEVVRVSSAQVAEAAKLLENIFRSVNIALVNEMKVVMDSMGIDIHEVIDVAATKPFGYMKFTPGPGLGGHCIPIDPFYLTWKAKEYGLTTRFIELAGEINTSMPHFIVNKILLALNERGRAVKGSSILILGISYKPDVDDMRESPSFKIMDELINLGAEISYHDPWISEIPKSREHMNWIGHKSIEWSKESLSRFDAVVIVTNHSNTDYKELSEWNDCIIDSRNAMTGIPPRHKGHITKA